MHVRGLMIGVASLVVGLVFMSLAIDEGEVVHLRTVGSDGREDEADLWIVDLDGRPHLRANSEGAGWLAELRAEPKVRLQREPDREWRSYRAVLVDDPIVRDRVEHEMRAKYGYAEFLWDWWVAPSESIAIRLDPVSSAERAP